MLVRSVFVFAVIALTALAGLTWFGVIAKGDRSLAVLEVVTAGIGLLWIVRVPATFRSRPSPRIKAIVILVGGSLLGFAVHEVVVGFVAGIWGAAAYLGGYALARRAARRASEDRDEAIR